MGPDETGKAATLDVRGARCPIPVLKARKRMKAVASGAVLTLISDDPVARIDVPHFCREDGHTLLGEDTAEDGTVSFRIQKR